MVAKPAIEELDLIETGPETSGPAGAGGLLGFGDDGGDFQPATPRSPQVYVTGIWIALASILMFFMGLTSSFIVRKGLGADWAPFTLPPLLWANSLVLLASSGTLELSRRAYRDGLRQVFRRWWHVTTALGLVFLIGQFVAWQQLRAAGVFLASNPSSSFFYLMTATHGLHLLGGILALAYVAARSRRADLVPWQAERAAVTATATYWHFLGGLWVFLFLLLWLGR